MSIILLDILNVSNTLSIVGYFIFGNIDLLMLLLLKIGSIGIGIYIIGFRCRSSSLILDVSIYITFVYKY